ncbi:MAG: hypothetical protein ACI9R3_004064 [Verrucomicrobiales bacterium]|jgi:hypothetical protein
MNQKTKIKQKLRIGKAVDLLRLVSPSPIFGVLVGMENTPIQDLLIAVDAASNSMRRLQLRMQSLTVLLKSQGICLQELCEELPEFDMNRQPFSKSNNAFR